ncbi:hsp70-binding protein 1-like [Glandiceps talaboti]
MASGSSGGGSGSGGDDRKGAEPKNLEALLKFAIENTPEDADSTSSQDQAHDLMSDERREWLQHALSGMYRDVVKEMHKCLKILNEKSESDNDEDVEEKENALEYLQDLCDSMDNAKDLHKIGGMPILKQCLRDCNSEIRWRCADLLATMTQNNPYTQQVLLDDQFLPVLIELLEKDEAEMVRIKALYAISCLVRTYPNAQQEFVKLDGFSVLIRALQSGIQKLQIKAAFMLKAMIVDNAEFKDTLYQMGFIQQLVALIQTPHDASHEHLLSVLINLVTGHPGCIKECQQPGLQLGETLRQKLKDLKDKEEYQEELEYSKELLSLCFPDGNDSQTTMDR